MNKVTTYITSTMRWQAAGRPVRTDDQVNELFATHCSKCVEWFRDGECTHPQCGCNVTSSNGEKLTILGTVLGGGMTNKLRRATERCPDRRWG